MNQITFPGLNLEFHISKKAFEIFGIEIYWYALLIVSSMIIAILIFKKRNGLYNIEFSKILDLLVFLIPISLVFARLYYIVFNLEYYSLNPMEILNTRGGGMAIYGGVIGGTITCIIFCKKRKINILDLLDYIVPGLVLGQAIGRWGNFINIEAYGTQTTLPWRMGIIKNGGYLEVHPTFLYESLVCLIIFIILLSLKNKRRFKGQITCIYLILYSIERTFVEGLRTDSLMIGDIRISQMLSILIFVISTSLYVVKMCNLQINKKMS